MSTLVRDECGPRFISFSDTPSSTIPRPAVNIHTPGQENTIRTCTPCRIRKTKCDGVLGQCDSCSQARRPMNCVYEDLYPEDDFRKEPLRRGEACVPCRRKKKRCNAARPSCDTCAVSGRSNGCVYKDSSEIARRRSTVSRFTAHPEYHVRSLRYRDDLRPVSLQPKLYPDPHSSVLARSEKSPYAIDSIFRRMFLQCRRSSGFRFSSAKREAILRGDLSNQIIHPFFIHFANMFGCNLFQERQIDISVASALYAHLELTHKALESLSEGDDPLSYAQAELLVALFCFYNHDLYLGRKFFRSCVRTVRKHCIRFVPPTNDKTQLPEFSEEVQERASFLSELLYSVVEIMALMGEPEDLLLDLREQFLHEFLPAYPEATQVCPVAVLAWVRTFTMETVSVLTSYSQQKMPTSTCLSSCLTGLSNCIHELRNIHLHLESCRSRNDHSAYFSLCFSLTLIQITLVQIGRMLGRHPMTLDAQCKLCDMAMEAVKRMLEGVPPDDLQFISELHQINCARGFSIFVNKERVPLATDPLGPRWPVVHPHSPFRDGNLAIMTLCQEKVATIRVDRFSRRWSGA